MSNSALFIDSENFKYKVKDILKDRHLSAGEKLEFHELDVQKLFANALKDAGVKERNYYSAKLHPHEGTIAKSAKLIDEQRRLKRKLGTAGFNFIISGHVRVQESVDKFLKKSYVFYEKGVDVRIGVDLVSYAYDKKVERVYLCSSESDLQPAIRKAREKGLKVTYVGFENTPNIGLTKTCDATILIRNSEIFECFERLDPWNKPA